MYGALRCDLRCGSSVWRPSRHADDSCFCRHWMHLLEGPCPNLSLKPKFFVASEWPEIKIKKVLTSQMLLKTCHGISAFSNFYGSFSFLFTIGFTFVSNKTANSNNLHRHFQGVISGLRRSVIKVFALLGCYAAWVSIYRLFGTTCQLLHKDQAVQEEWTAWTLNMGPIISSETR